MRIINRVAFFVVLIGFMVGCDREFRKAKSYEKQGDWPNAQQVLITAITKRPDDPRFHNELGFVYQKRGYFDLAMEEYTKAIVLDPYYLEAFYNRGTLFVKWGQALAAQKDFEKAIQIDKNYAKAYNNLGLLLQIYLGKPDEALKNYKTAIDLEPDNPTYHFNLSQLYKQMGKNDLANEEQERAKALAAKQKR
jgi:tetratricopeptide (TPR) repeat protein